MAEAAGISLEGVDEDTGWHAALEAFARLVAASIDALAEREKRGMNTDESLGVSAFQTALRITWHLPPYENTISFIGPLAP